MKHFGFPAAYFIGWARIARPGSILGPQQFFLVDKEPQLLGKHISDKFDNMSMQCMSPEDKRKSKFGDDNQGDDLVSRKMQNPKYHYRGGF